jgi:hypothetical protein
MAQVSEVVKALGHHGHWGFSAPFDCLEALSNAHVCSSSSSESGAEPINILLLHAGDIRCIPCATCAQLCPWSPILFPTLLI